MTISLLKQYILDIQGDSVDKQKKGYLEDASHVGLVLRASRAVVIKKITIMKPTIVNVEE